ncbi:uncharacterized protein ASPGLDRAFT_61973 [Aspergillus glaucus CBS 516.65]|uniref:Condensation domain-containing protein n=1 Tax=Aspergillus glaucus CBS 516.65 TaxID=1160497 RepID=A0A1L9V5R6_ASPGL|nr:hypothetical protein ASPGLDRAFT_61973 [Aspergillus glaucus CBS 516.65]OJJ79231.1 hypothetical protein ASPGLDRAFT_61973 [Aspergillus glaucus CBS 516.65]
MERVVPIAKTIQCADSEVLPVFRKYLSNDLPLDQYILHRLTLASTESGRVFGMIELHHDIGDKGARDVLEAELDALYHADQPLADSPPSTDAPQSLIPTDSPITDLGDSRKVDVPLLPLEIIKQFSRSQECTQSSLFKALWAVVLQFLVGSQDVAFLYLVSTRYAPGVQAGGAIGNYLEILWARVRAAGTTSFKEILKNVQEDYSRALTHLFAAINTFRELGLEQTLTNTIVNHRRHHCAESEERSSSNQKSFSWKYYEYSGDALCIFRILESKDPSRDRGQYSYRTHPLPVTRLDESGHNNVADRR